MAGSVFGSILKVTTWGESHGPAIGAVLDGFPAGMELCEADIQPFLDRRRPGRTAVSTPRREDDRVELLSGVFEGKTTGTPISMLIRSNAQRSADYGDLKDCFRPGHADYGYYAKYGIRDYRGGGRSSGRETAGRVAAGAVAAKLLRELGIDLFAYTAAIGPVAADPAAFDRSLIAAMPTAMPDAEANRRAMEYLAQCMEEKDSAGGVIEAVIRGVPAGIGDPVFDKLDARLASALVSIGGVKAVEIGDGMASAAAKGSENNDLFIADEATGGITAASNHAGGILGGISDGCDILLRCSIKPTPSIFREQTTVDESGAPRRLLIRGRHDPVIVPRAVVVVEAMCALTILDAMLCGMSARAEDVRRFYRKK
ncbi:chorismate synthase [Lachnoclostridium sp. Marseille-P6806]|uniref:chorismate synthase n=1 Tax=Lachnoclostridium sp. Marseille-P6806 TaxID=2364793 RepID=UPI00103056F9|nr:chorismate synthase [Lachnoclostridium sp. Marseille-P6806]